MKEQLRVLIELQQFDARIQELQQSIRALPERLAPAKRDLAKLETIVQGEQAELAATEKWRRDQEATLKQEDEQIRKAKAKLQASSSSKEFAAASRELEAKRKSMNEREEEILKVIEALESSRKTIAEHEADVQKLRGHIASEDAEIAAKVAELQRQADELLGGRGALLERIDKATLKRYETIQQRRGVAVVEVIHGSCQGCHMKLPPQLVNILARMDSFETCPNCYRLLYTKAMLDGGAAQS
jgi:hypothetical protein